MTIRALAGLVALHAVFLGVGAAVLFALGALERRRDALRLAGVGYLLGIAALGIAWTCLLAVGVPFGTATIVLTGVAIAAVALGLGARRGFSIGRPGRVALRPAVLVTAAGVAVVGLYLEALFRSARLEGLYSFDGWAFWVARGKAIYFTRGFDPDVLAAVPHGSYPPVVVASRLAASRPGRRRRRRSDRPVAPLVPRARHRRGAHDGRHA